MDYANPVPMFSSNYYTADFPAQMGRKLLDEFGLSYVVSYPDAYIELDDRKVCIEFDRTIHDGKDLKANDEIHDPRLAHSGYIILRFTTYDLMNERSYVLSPPTLETTSTDAKYFSERALT